MGALELNHPERLLWLLLLLPIVLLALPPRPRRALWTAHMAEWLLARAALRRRPLRLPLLRLLLLLAAVAACVFAHADPVRRGPPGARRLLVLLDASASMGARRADGGTAYDAAVAQLRARLPSLPVSLEVTVLRCGVDVQRWQGAAARALAAPGTPAGAGAALAALADAAPPDAAVWTLTDGRGPGPLPTRGALTLLGEVADNAAIAGVVAHDHWPLPALELDVDLVAFSARPVQGALQVAGAVAAAGPFRVALQPGEHRTARLELQRTAAGGTLSLRLQVDGDALAADDAWSAALRPLPLPRIGVLGADADIGILAAAAKALADEVGGTVVAAAAGRADCGFLLVEGGVTSAAAGQARMVAFGSRLADGAAPAAWDHPTVLDWDRRDPLTLDLDLSDLRIDQALHDSLPAGRALVWGARSGAGEEPLAVVVDGPAPSLHFAFRLQDSNLALLPAFPQLLRRAFVQSHGAGAGLQPVVGPPFSAGESDLRAVPAAADRPLPPLGQEDQELAPWCVLAAALLLAVRAYVR